MSKITKALEKAARERLQRLQDETTVLAKPMELSLASPVQLDAVTIADRIQVDPHIVAAADAKSPIAEQYRILRTNLQSLRMRPGAKLLMVTSAMDGEGKSVTAI